ncbi:MAG: YbjN domain-containing protein [Verrucomicrobiae bacterium]|nr:YbjN domain-containing protein [Verrucomicrobiae bacterium]
MTHVTLDMMKDYLKRFGWHTYKAVQEPFEKEGIIFTGWYSSDEDEGYLLAIDPMVERGCLSFRVPKILQASPASVPSARIGELCCAMGYVNCRLLVGKFAFDPSDGEVRFSVDLPIEGNTLTYEQFVHCLGATIHAVESYAPALRKVAAGLQTIEEFIAWDEEQSCRELKKSFVDFLRELLKRLEQDSESGLDEGRANGPGGGNGDGRLN